MSADFSPSTRLVDQAAASGKGEFDLLRCFYLRRLHVIVEKVRHHGGYLVASDKRMVLLNRALLSTFCQCCDLGVEHEARRLLGTLRGEHKAGPAPASPALAPT